MGIVQRQGLRNTLISYIGLGIGFVSSTLVLTRLLTPAQLGLTSVLVSLATIAAQVAGFGFANAAVRYFPYFRDPKTGHSGFLPLLLGVPLVGFVAVAGALWAGKGAVLRLYAHDANLLGPNYGALLGLVLAVLLLSLQDAYLKSLFHTSFAAFLQEIFLRLYILGAAGLYWRGYVSFDGFVLAYAGGYALVDALLAAYLLAIGELHLRPTRAALRVRPWREMLAFSGFALLGNLSGTVMVSIDSLMLGAQLSLAAAGIYAIAFNISTALTLPFRALYKTAFPLIAGYWKEGRMDRLADFYARTTRLGTVLGCYLALGLALNLDFVYGLIHRPAYAAGAAAVLLLLAGRLVDGITSVNGIIVLTSPRYRFDLVFNLGLAGAIVGLNALLIPRLGLAGAALSNCLALTVLNLLRTWFVWRAYGLQPFDRRIPLIGAVAAAAGALTWLLPVPASLWGALLVRGGALTVLYGSGLLLTKAAPEVNVLAAQGWVRLRGRRA